MEEEYQTYQPKWEEKKAESERHHHHHHHHHHYYEYSRSSSHRSNGIAGWLKERDKQAWIGLMLILAIGLSFGAYKLYSMYRDELKEIKNVSEADAVDVDELGDNKLFAELNKEKGAELAAKTNVDTLVRTVTGDYHNVYRPARKNDNETIDDREWSKIKQNLRRWFRAHGTDWKFILALTGLGLLIIGLVGYGIYKYKHPHGKYRL